MIRTGAQYRDSIRDGRQVWVDGEQVEDVTTHPRFKPLVDIRARMYDLRHEPATRDVLSFDDGGGERHAIANKLPLTQEDWWEKRRATDAVLGQVGAALHHAGHEAVGELWSLFDGLDVLNELGPQFSGNIRCQVNRVLHEDPFHVAADSDSGSDRDKLLRVVRETDAGIVVRGARCATAAAYANQAFVTPATADWGAEARSDHVLGFVCDMGTANLKFLCRGAGTLVVFEDVLVPWENVLFLRSTEAARLVGATLHRYSAFAFVQRCMKHMDMLIGAALWNARRTGSEKDPSIRDRLSLLACHREALNAHLTASITLSERSPAGLMMPNQSLLHAGRVLASGQSREMARIARELGAGEVGLAPVRDLLERGCPRDAGPALAQLDDVYRNFDWEEPLDFVRRAAGLVDAVP